MNSKFLNWDEYILDSKPDGLGGYESLAVGDIDGDGEMETVCGGCAAMYWYRPKTGEKGLIEQGIYNAVGILCKDINGDGKDEIFFAEDLYGDQKEKRICWYELKNDEWVLHIIDNKTYGLAHDIIFADVDNDGEEEILALNCYTTHHGICIYKRQNDILKEWTKYDVEEFTHPEATPYAEGLNCADINGDGKLEIIDGPYYFTMPEGGALSGTWNRVQYADDFREMCRTKLYDFTGSGRLDIVITDSEFMDGKLSWFENMGNENGKVVFKEHVLADDLYYSHSLQIYKENGVVYILVAEMEKGGWDAFYNFDSRVMRFATDDFGKTFERQILKNHSGTHEAKLIGFEKGKQKYIVGKTLGRDLVDPRVQLFMPPKEKDKTLDFKHSFVDRYKPTKSTDMMCADIDKDGKNELICGNFYYRSEDFKRFDIPVVSQIINSYDVDNDGQAELIGVISEDNSGLGNKLVLLKLIDADKNLWKTTNIGVCKGDWPHGNTIAPFGKNGEVALVVSMHSANFGNKDYPQMFVMPNDPFSGEWKSSLVAPILYGEELVAADLNDDGLLDIVAGKWWLKNNGDMTFTAVDLLEDRAFMAARVAVGDINGDGKDEIVMTEEKLDFNVNKAFMGRVIWLEKPENPENYWTVHNIDTMRSPHSLSISKDEDGVEILVAEHDPFYPYRNRGRAFIYRPVMGARAFKKSLLDHRFEHHDGMKVVDFIEGKQCVVSQSWTEYNYVHLWTRDK